jgi:hypothetical protein
MFHSHIFAKKNGRAHTRATGVQPVTGNYIAPEIYCNTKREQSRI